MELLHTMAFKKLPKGGRYDSPNHCSPPLPIHDSMRVFEIIYLLLFFPHRSRTTKGQAKKGHLVPALAAPKPLYTP